jgi:hypothetical protein
MWQGLIDLGMVESAEVLMPYMLGAGGQSFFDTHRQKLIEAWCKASARPRSSGVIFAPRK